MRRLSTRPFAGFGKRLGALRLAPTIAPPKDRNGEIERWFEGFLAFGYYVVAYPLGAALFVGLWWEMITEFRFWGFLLGWIPAGMGAALGAALWPLWALLLLNYFTK